MPRALAWSGASAAWGRDIGSATGLYFLEVPIYANVPAFLWLGYYGWGVTRGVRSVRLVPDAD